MKKIFLFILSVYSLSSFAAERFYELNIDYKKVSFSGNKTQAMAINGSIPGPTLEFTIGDTAVIKVNNQLDTNASIHWHGLLLPQDQDGVPYLTFFPIKPGESFTYRFPIIHTGTYWYHSHTNIDEQRGQYGSIVIHPEEESRNYQFDEVVVLSDWTDENPHSVLKNLKKDGDWYALKKDSVISIWEYLKRGRLTAWLKNRWQRMEGMDVSDVGYDAFLANGNEKLQIAPQAKPGDVVRLRFINAGASSYFRLQQHSTPFTVIAADGLDVQPVQVKEILMGMAETYDVLVTIPQSGALQINANNVDGTGHSSIMVGSGEFEAAPLPEKPDLFVAMDHGSHETMDHSNHNKAEMDHSHHMSHSDNKATHAQHDMSSMDHSKHSGKAMDHSTHKSSAVAETLNYKMLKTLEPVIYQGEMREVVLNLTGDMESYNWSFNNTPISAADKILINRGEIVRFVFVNESMMHHPMHLHGHFFKVISGNGNHDVLKHTVDVPPMETVVIEFAANEEKDWLFHCHNLYHAKTGMGRIVRYSDYSGNKAFDMAKMKSDEIMDTDWYQRTDLNAYEDWGEFHFRYGNAKHAFKLEAETFEWDESEASLAYLYKLNRWTEVFARAEDEQGEHAHGHFGVRYHLPFSIDSELYIDTDAEVILELEAEFQLSKHIALEMVADTEDFWELGLEYRFTPNVAIGAYKNEIVDWTGGIKLTF